MLVEVAWDLLVALQVKRANKFYDYKMYIKILLITPNLKLFPLLVLVICLFFFFVIVIILSRI